MLTQSVLFVSVIYSDYLLQRTAYLYDCSKLACELHIYIYMRTYELRMRLYDNIVQREKYHTLYHISSSTTEKSKETSVLWSSPVFTLRWFEHANSPTMRTTLFKQCVRLRIPVINAYKRSLGGTERGIITNRTPYSYTGTS